MVKDFRKQSSYTATSNVGTDDASIIVAYMNANYDEQSNLNFSQNIHNYAMYKANKAVVDADYETFKENVLDDIGE